MDTGKVLLKDSDIYKKYFNKAAMALIHGYTYEDVLEELRRERASIMPRCSRKQAELAHDRNPYKAKEALRTAKECLNAIDEVIVLLEKKEMNV